jgi:hypothetical protein
MQAQRTTTTTLELCELPMPAVRLFVGGHAGTVQGEREDLAGDRCFTAAHPPQAARFRDADEIDALLDSGAFTDPPHKRLTHEGALERQFRWEGWAARIWEHPRPWTARHFVSYDLLIDEKWVDGKRHKERWDIKDAGRAAEETVAAARYLASQRERIEPRTLVLSCQGVDAYQYQECVTEVLKVAQPHDWIGLGGWCILGMKQAWMPTFWQTMRLVLPQIAASGVKHIHIFGVLFLKAIGGLSWLADQYGLTVSTDSTAPVLACTWKNWKKAGARDPYWRNNVKWWVDTLANIRQTDYYKEPPRLAPARQETFL